MKRFPFGLIWLICMLCLASSALGGSTCDLACPDPPASCSPTVPCSGEDCVPCANVPFEPTTCWPTEYGTAAADVVTTSANFLYCDTGNYALCFFSGPPFPTGNLDSHPTNPALPCVLSDDGKTADCACEAFTASAEQPYYVDINSILNLGAYNETVYKCGADGSRCKNIVSMKQLHCPDGPDGPTTPNGCLTPPVCAYLAGQNAADMSTSLLPGADLISAFSFAMGSSSDKGEYTVGSTPCNGVDSGLYAGCMTAPCRYPSGVTAPSNDPSDPTIVQCACPTFLGEFQVGQDQYTLEQASFKAGAGPDVCNPGLQGQAFYVWSASNTISD